MQLWSQSEPRVREPVAEVPRMQWQPLRPTLPDVFAAGGDPICEAHRRWGYSIREIAEHIGRHYSTVSRRIQRAELTTAA